VRVPRVACHPDGKIAVHVDDELALPWFLIDPVNFMISWVPIDVVKQAGWQELFVAQLPAPDRFIECEGDDNQPATTPQWERSGLTVTAWTEGIEINDCGLTEQLDEAYGQSLAILAAVVTSRRFNDAFNDKKET